MDHILSRNKHNIHSLHLFRYTCMSEIFLVCLFGKPIVVSLYKLLVRKQFKGYVKISNNELSQIYRANIVRNYAAPKYLYKKN